MRFLLLMCVAWLAGCSTLSDVKPDPETIAQRESSWKARQLDYSALVQWQLQGRLSISSDHESWFLKANWYQKADRIFDLFLSGPFSTAIQLSSTENEIVFSDGEKTVYAPDAELLLLEHTGIRMPVNGLRYWLIGLPQPGKTVKSLQLDEKGRLYKLEQDQWNVEIKGYQLQDGKEVPTQLSIVNHRIKVRLIVDKWTTSLASQQG